MILIARPSPPLKRAGNRSRSRLKFISYILAASRPVSAQRAIDRQSTDLAQRRFEIDHEIRIRPIAGRGPSDDDVIGTRLSAARQHLGGNRTQSPLGPIANHRITDLSACGKADPYRLTTISLGRTAYGLQDEPRSHSPAAFGGNTKKIGSVLQPYKAARHQYPHRGKRARFLPRAGHRVGAAEASGGETLAALRAARRQHPATARGRHSRTKAVATLADELARLVSALHGAGSNEYCLDWAEAAI
jgi:hypothetical protein